MKTSRYFSELMRSYSDEVDDLVTDSAGASVLQKRLNEKRREMDAILPMIEFSPEMVAVAFYDAFGFSSPQVMQKLALSEPGDSGFLPWKALKGDLTVVAWAEPLIHKALRVDGGDAFLVVVAVLEFLRTRSFAAPVAEVAEEDGQESWERGDESDDDGDEADDLSEAGADWLSEQGFESLDR